MQVITQFSLNVLVILSSKLFICFHTQYNGLLQQCLAKGLRINKI